ncbi:uncharacterized protein MYCFIDRAFT_37626 [Pseudocercospora fijiensis CIRAD86]|uniref:Enoyl reductase (ER) domain-containing protein n=1 Tax=Pseudocercospora fijiensis (strain CIRAD86) TaxID=383855 RepID=M3A584_PSEFD|nr:uncharacterized protein MYCFIDRAFT_37626 [Pseudocercospora fijiensis CIRAD86]EME79756.1 hypothetical protein MYCFIDRAFT_37626 [Pseudocercospora fijiensis CIRAD86]
MSTALPSKQTIIVQRKTPGLPKGRLPLAVAHGRAVPELRSDHDVLVQVLAVGLNPVDAKMVSHFFMEDTPAGCDFFGVVVLAGSASTVRVGSRVIAGELPYRQNNQLHGGFSQYAIADARHTILVPDHWSDTLAAGLGNLSWATVGLAMSKPDALALTGKPSAPSEKAILVLVYGGGTATGCIAIQMLKRSGYDPIAVCSDRSAPRAMSYGAIGTASYTSPNCVEEVRKIAQGRPIKHALDCITQPDSVEICFNVLARLGARYACLEDCPEAWRPRRSVKVNIIMGYEQLGYDVELGDSVYTRKSNPESVQLCRMWAAEIQEMVNRDLIQPLPIKEVEGQFEGIVRGLEEISKGKIAGTKLVVRLV